MSGALRRMLKVTLPVLGVLLVFHCVAVADQVQLTLAYVDDGTTMGGVYTSPYDIQVGSSSHTVLDLSCDDFTTDITLGYSWYAMTYSLSNVTNSGPQKFFSDTGNNGDVYNPDVTTTSQTGPTLLGSYSFQTMYLAAAFLAQDLIYAEPGSTFQSLVQTQQQVNPDSELGGEYSFAIWQIFDPTAYLGWSKTNELTQAERAEVETLMDSAFTLATNGTQLAHGLVIYTPCGELDDGGCVLPGNSEYPDTDAAQEFLGFGPSPDKVPDGPVSTTLIFELLALFGAAFLVRKRIQRNGLSN